MPLNKSGLTAAIKTLSEHPGGNTSQEFANGLADAIEAYVKSGTVTVPALGLISASPGAPVTGSAIGSIS